MKKKVASGSIILKIPFVHSDEDVQLTMKEIKKLRARLDRLPIKKLPAFIQRGKNLDPIPEDGQLRMPLIERMEVFPQLNKDGQFLMFLIIVEYLSWFIKIFMEFESLTGGDAMKWLNGKTSPSGVI